MKERRDANEDVFQLMMATIEPRLLPGESFDDVVAGIRYLMTKRAELLGRPVIAHLDALFVCAWWTWWPFKHPAPPSYERAILEIRPTAFAGASQGETDRLEFITPNATLGLSLESLHWIMMRGNVYDLVRPFD
jgi:hypothetical protein